MPSVISWSAASPSSSNFAASQPASKRPPEITLPSSLLQPSSCGCDKCPHYLEHDPRVEPEGMLFGKPVPTPHQARGRLFPDHALGGVDSKDSLLGANQIQRCFWGGSLGCDGTVGFERRGVGADSTADHRPA